MGVEQIVVVPGSYRVFLPRAPLDLDPDHFAEVDLNVEQAADAVAAIMAGLMRNCSTPADFANVQRQLMLRLSGAPKGSDNDES